MLLLKLRIGKVVGGWRQRGVHAATGKSAAVQIYALVA
jgi:hypothetical protein